ncbi:MAG: DinB family protein, partial [Acidimicrobiales bacterium]
MAGSILRDAFDHHVWATTLLIDVCAPLSDEQLGTVVTGTYGPILGTTRHLVDSDRWYLSVITNGRIAPLEHAEQMDLAALRTAMDENGVSWSNLLDDQLDPDEAIIRRRDDGSEFRAPLGIRLAQAVHHGSDHRSQICT